MLKPDQLNISTMQNNPKIRPQDLPDDLAHDNRSHYRPQPISTYSNTFGSMKLLALFLLAILMLAIPVAMSQDAEHWITKTKSDYYNGSYPLALDDIDQYLKINQSDTWAWSFRANLLLKMERYEEAVESFDKIISLDQSNAKAYNDRALVLSGGLNQDEEALASLEAALQIDLLNANAWYNKGMVLEKMERYNESLEAYRKAIDLDGDLDRAWYRQGHVLLIVQRFDESLASLDKAIEFNSENAEAWNDKGVILRRLERNEEALDCFHRAIKLDPSNELYQENLNDLGWDEPTGDSPGVVSEKVLDFS